MRAYVCVHLGVIPHCNWAGLLDSEYWFRQAACFVDTSSASQFAHFCVCVCVLPSLLCFLQPLSPANEERPVAQEEDKEDEDEEGEERPHIPNETQPSQDETTSGEPAQSEEPQLPVQSTTATPRASDVPPIRLPTTKYTPPQTKWTPKTPQEPMDKLVHMGFANRTLNGQLLAKHNGHLRAVINDLLDNQDKL